MASASQLAADTASPTGERQVRSPGFCGSPKAAKPRLALELGAQNLPGTTFSAHRSAFLFLKAVARRWGLVVPWFPGRSRRAAGRGLMESWLSDQSPVGSAEDGGRQEEAKYKNIREKCGAGLQCY